MTDTITVSLTREEAGVLLTPYPHQYPPISHNTADPPNEATLTCPACSAVVKIRAALDRESETPTQAPRKSPEPGPPITEEQVERGAKAILAVEQAGQVNEDWYCGLARACLEAARDA